MASEVERALTLTRGRLEKGKVETTVVELQMLVEIFEAAEEEAAAKLQASQSSLSFSATAIAAASGSVAEWKRMLEAYAMRVSLSSTAM